MQMEIKKYPSLIVYEDSVEDILISSCEVKERPEVTAVVLGR